MVGSFSDRDTTLISVKNQSKNLRSSYGSIKSSQTRVAEMAGDILATSLLAVTT